ncbi:hypothetical protein H0H93_008489, partial [Arthromyces matolae]
TNIILPNLEELILDSCLWGSTVTLAHHILQNLSAPRLQSFAYRGNCDVRNDADCFPALAPFLKKFGRHIRTLHLLHGDHQSLYHPDQALLNSCPSLEGIVLLSSDALRLRHPTVQWMYILSDREVDIQDETGENLKVRTTKAFPNLRSIGIIRNTITTLGYLPVFEILAALPKHSDGETNNDSDSFRITGPGTELTSVSGVVEIHRLIDCDELFEDDVSDDSDYVYESESDSESASDTSVFSLEGLLYSQSLDGSDSDTDSEGLGSGGP